ncbi:hypothetical protein [Legionella longbeachae]|uniref:hypothetical protein n=1 Tax=Legionella longbeachae TaxID=450 RepID=UPI000A1C0168|nr:hypothetical protein [Legionella longbeachae]
MSTSKIELLIDKTMRKCFYYQYSDEQQTYSTIPSGGEIDSDKLRQKDPKFWVSRSLNEKSIPKNLIINDIFLSYRSKNEVEQLKNILSELINQKFPIFLWQKGSLVPLNQDNLSQLDNNEIIESITQAYPDSIIKLAVQNHRLTKNSILLLDDYWVSQLLENNKKPQERAIYASIWKKLDDSSKIEALEILTKSSPKLTQFIDDIFPEDGEVIPPVQMDLKRVKRYKIITIQAGENNLETISKDRPIPVIEAAAETHHQNIQLKEDTSKENDNAYQNIPVLENNFQLQENQLSQVNQSEKTSTANLNFFGLMAPKPASITTTTSAISKIAEEELENDPQKLESFFSLK